MILCLRIYKVTIFLCLIISLQGCTSPAPTKALNFSGFLGNYSGLRPAPDGSGAWNYRKPNVDFKPYTKIMLDPLVTHHFALEHYPDAYAAIEDAQAHTMKVMITLD